MKLALTLATLLAGLSLVACGERPSPADTQDPRASANDEPSSFIGRAAKKGLDKAREKIKTENLSISNVHVGAGDVQIGDQADRSGNRAPDAEITPQGDLLIEGAKVQVNAEQHALLKRYRSQIEGVAMTGMDIGEQGAEIAGKALTEAFTGIFSGNADQIDQRVEQQVEADTDKIKLAAIELCDQLPAMMATQQALAASLPEFKPYATMEQSDIDECYDDDDLAKVSEEVRIEKQQEVRQNIRQGIRSGIRNVAQAVGVASSGTGDTVTVNGIRFLLPPGGVSTETANGNTSIEVGNGLRVRLEDGELWVNGEQYPAPKTNGEVDLGTSGTVKVDGEVVAAL